MILLMMLHLSQAGQRPNNIRRGMPCGTIKTWTISLLESTNDLGLTGRDQPSRTRILLFKLSSTQWKLHLEQSYRIRPACILQHFIIGSAIITYNRATTTKNRLPSLIRYPCPCPCHYRSRCWGVERCSHWMKLKGDDDGASSGLS